MCLNIAAAARFKEIDDALDQFGIPVIMPVNRSLPDEEVAIASGGALLTIRQVGTTRLTELAPTRWSWPSPRGRAVTTFRSEGLRFPYGRCLVPVAWADISASRAGLSRVRLRSKNAPWFCLAGFWRNAGSAGDCFALLTQAATGDLATVTPRQLIVVEPERWAAWLDGTTHPSESLRSEPSCRLELTDSPLAPSPPHAEAARDSASEAPLQPSSTPGHSVESKLFLP